MQEGYWAPPMSLWALLPEDCVVLRGPCLAAGHDIVEAIQMWYDEVAFYTHSTKHCVPDEVCGHYTQVSFERHSFVVRVSNNGQ